MAVRIQFRRGTAAEWTAANPTLAVGELGHETDTGQFKIGTGSADWANLSYSSISESYLESYVDNAVSNLIDSAPGALDTLNELANAINNDNNFYGTLSSTINGKLSFVANTDANFATANAIMAANTLYILSDFPGYVKLGDGVTTYNNLEFVSEGLVEARILTHNQTSTNVHGISDTANLVYSITLQNYATTETTNSLSSSIGNVASDVSSLETEVSNISNSVSTLNNNVSDLSTNFTTTNLTANGNTILGANTAIGNVTSTEISYLDGVTSGIQTQINNANNGITDLENLIGSITSTEIGYLDNVSSNIQQQLDDRLSISDAANTYAPLANASFSGSVTLPSTTSIGNITSEEIGYLDNVSSNIQAQLDNKLSTASAASIYAPLSDPIFVSTVTLPANTLIGSVNGTEIGYLDNVTSNIQAQLDSKAPLANATFTGTVSGITAAMVGLGNVNNTADLDKPISNATQTALDAKLSLSGGTMTGKITLDGDPSQALHAATKQYVDNLAAGLHVHEAAHAATTDTLANLIASTVTYDNGTDGVGATLSLGANLTTLDGHTLNNGDRILVKNQANAAHNGIYVRTSATLLTRADDFNSAAEIAGGDLVFVENGTLYNSTAWVVENEVNTVGTDNILWAQFSGAGTVTAGTNIQVDGLQVSVISNPTFANVVTASSGVAFSDGTQTRVGVPSITTISQQTGSYTLSSLAERDTIIEINSTSETTVTIPNDSSVNYPVGTTLDIIQTNTGQVTIAGAGGVTVNATPGLKLRARWSSVTLLKRSANTWLAFGDLSA